MSSQSQHLKKLHEAALQGIVDDLVKEKEDGWKSRTVRDSYTTKLNCLELMGISMTRDALYKRVACQIKKRTGATSELVVELTADQNNSEVSTLTSPSTGGSSDLLDDEDTDEHEVMDCSARGGRPKGSTNQKKRDDVKKYKECVNAIAHAYNDELTKQRGLQQKLVKCFWSKSFKRKRKSLV